MTLKEEEPWLPKRLAVRSPDITVTESRSKENRRSDETVFPVNIKEERSDAGEAEQRRKQAGAPRMPQERSEGQSLGRCVRRRPRVIYPPALPARRGCRTCELELESASSQLMEVVRTERGSFFQ